MVDITVVKSAGFCFGVDRAVKMVDDLVAAGKKVSTLGPIIHNKQVTDRLSSQGVRVIEKIDEANPNECVVIRSHGVSNSIYDKLAEKNTDYVDATCPFVSKIHKIVAKNSALGADIIIFGDVNHPEVEGIRGHCSTNSYVVKNEEELEALAFKGIISIDKSVVFVAQTTFNLFQWKNCEKSARKLYTNALFFDTICNATSFRQQETNALAQSSEIMIVIGGKNSSNTIKLFQLCTNSPARAYHIESADELGSIDFTGAKKIGVTAGASTPAHIIQEVVETMSEILNDVNSTDEEFNFEEALELSLKKIYTGNRVKGVITSVNNNEAIVDIGVKQTGYIPYSELTDDSSLKPSDVVTVGEEIELIVIKVNDQEGVVTLSKKKVDSLIGFEKIVAASEQDAVLEGVVTNVVKGGIIVLCNGVRVFVPASQSSLQREENLENLKGNTVRFKVLEVNEGRGRAVGSIKAVLKEAQKAEQEKFWDTIEVGQVFKGAVKSLTSYGAFVNLGSIDGMVHISELSWKRIKHPSEVVKVGDVLEVFVKDLDKDRKRISLGFKKAEDNPWEILSRNYSVGQNVDAKVVSLTPFGAFAQIIPGIDGLIHVSQISNERVDNVADVLKVGQEVQVQITDIDLEKKRISLSMKALVPAAEEKDSEEQAEIKAAAQAAGVEISSDEE